MTVLNESLHAGGFIVSEANGFLSRDKALAALSQTLKAGQLLGARVLIAAATSLATADASNTVGAGAITLDVATPVLVGAQNGAYRVVCIEPAANSGTFEVFDPQGVPIGKVVVGATFANQVKFVIADATDFAAGDAFTITVGVEPGDKEMAAFDPAATDGLQHVAAINFAPVVTDGVTKQPITIISRAAEVRLSDLTFPAGITDVQKAAALAELYALGIIAR